MIKNQCSIIFKISGMISTNKVFTLYLRTLSKVRGAPYSAPACDRLIQREQSVPLY